jgi:hypothetical protein
MKDEWLIFIINRQQKGWVAPMQINLRRFRHLGEILPLPFDLWQAGTGSDWRVANPLFGNHPAEAEFRLQKAAP